MLHEFLSANRDELISRCRSKVARRRSPLATKRELESGIPVFLDQLAGILRGELLASVIQGASFEVETAADSHGATLLLEGFTVDQVVHDYGDLCQAVTELAIETNAQITNAEFHTLNRCLDDAIAHAVSEFAQGRELAITDASEHTMNVRLGFLAHEFRNLINTAMLAVNVLKRGSIGISGSTGAVLDRSLRGLRDISDRVLVDVRLKAGIQNLNQRVRVSEFIEEAQVAAAIDADQRGLQFIVHDIERGLEIEVDSQILAGALANLLQNAFKFTIPFGTVSLKAYSSGDRVLIEVEDECGGLPNDNHEDLFRPFEQRSGDRTGLGLGLGISRRAVEINRGKLRVRNLPGKGCVFTIDLPAVGAIRSGLGV